jgi:hypothetical protein
MGFDTSNSLLAHWDLWQQQQFENQLRRQQESRLAMQADMLRQKFDWEVDQARQAETRRKALLSGVAGLLPQVPAGPPGYADASTMEGEPEFIRRGAMQPHPLQDVVGALPTEDLAAIAHQMMFPEPPKPFVATPGAAVFNAPDTPPFMVPTAEGVKPPALRTRISGKEEIQEEFDPITRTWRQIGQGPRWNDKPLATANASIQGPFTPQQTFSNEAELRKEYKANIKGYQSVLDAYNQVAAILNGPISAPATLAAATRFMKMLDSDSVAPTWACNC